jgi:ribonuclease HII
MSRLQRKNLRARPDEKCWEQHEFVAGCDEAGRGPLAGPVVAAAVILPRNFFHPEIDDSKKLTARKREELFHVIEKVAVAHAFGIVDHSVIDEINILNSTKRAMREAITGLATVPEMVLIDAVRVDGLPFPQVPIIGGDALSISIAAASILAKVKRDTIMVGYGAEYPQYKFERHKGYPTRMHRECIRKYGPCPIHRMSFRLL